MKHPNRVLLIVLSLALIFRIFLAPLAFHRDLIIQANWGKHISYSGIAGFYHHGDWIFSWPNHPPLTSLYYGLCHQIYIHLSAKLHQSLNLLNKLHINHPILSPYTNFAQKFDEMVSSEEPFDIGFLFTLKLFPIIADLLISILIYKIAQSKSKKPIIYPIVYLFSPFSWYLSSLWGQTDQIAYFFTILSFLIIPKRTTISILLFYFGVTLKPTGMFLVPLYLYLLFKTKPKIFSVITAFIICLILTYITFKPFTPDKNIFEFTFTTLLPRLADRPSRLSTNSFNFWHIFILNLGLPGNTKFLFLSGNFWSLLAYFAINLFAFKFLKKINTKSIITSLFIVSFGSWLFLTNMLDRYSFAGIVTGLLLTIYHPKLTVYWLMLSVCYWLNLFHGWWYPESFFYLRNFLAYNQGIFTSIPSLINVITYILVGRYLFRSS